MAGGVWGVLLEAQGDHEAAVMSVIELNEAWTARVARLVERYLLVRGKE